MQEILCQPQVLDWLENFHSMTSLDSNAPFEMVGTKEEMESVPFDTVVEIVGLEMVAKREKMLNIDLEEIHNYQQALDLAPDRLVNFDLLATDLNARYGDVVVCCRMVENKEDIDHVHFHTVAEIADLEMVTKMESM